MILKSTFLQVLVKKYWLLFIKFSLACLLNLLSSVVLLYFFMFLGEILL